MRKIKILIFAILMLVMPGKTMADDDVTKKIDELLAKEVQYGRALYELHEKNGKLDFDSKEYQELIKQIPVPIFSEQETKIIQENFKEWEKKFRNEKAKFKIVIPKDELFLTLYLFEPEVKAGIFDIKTIFNSGFFPLKAYSARTESLIEEGKKQNACIIDPMPLTRGITLFIVNEVRKNPNGKYLVSINAGKVKVTCESLELEKEFSYEIFFDNFYAEDCRAMTKEILNNIKDEKVKADFEKNFSGDKYLFCFSKNNPGNGNLITLITHYALPTQIKQWLLKELKYRGIIQATE